MCGRYSLILPLDLILNELELELPDFGLTARYNAAPTQLLPVVTMDQPRKLQMMRWGLIPFWAKDPAIGNKMINARAETLQEKPSYRTLVSRQRCIVLADGFYEWKAAGKRKQPFRISPKDGALLALAGLWDKWKDAEGREIRTFTIITCEPNDLMKDIHNRMPAILEKEARQAWLDSKVKGEDAMKLLLPLREGVLQAVPVSTLLNSPAHDGPEVLVTQEVE